MSNQFKNYKEKIRPLFVAYFFFTQSLFSTSISHHLASQKIILTKELHHIRMSNAVCDDEKAVIARRKNLAKPALEALLGQNLEEQEIPNIGIASSGGGYRSMICTLGFLTALEKKQILDTVSYMATVSGSGWTLATWIAQSKTLSELKDFLRTQALTDLGLFDFDWGTFAQQLFRKISAGQPINQSDIWGCLLAQVLLNGLQNGGQGMLFSDLGPKIKSGKYPFPILTAIIDDTLPYEWCDFTPFEVGSFSSQAWVASSQFGKRFAQGVSTDSGPEQTLGYILGLTSSIFAVPFAELLDSAIEMLPQKCCQFEDIFTDYFSDVMSDLGNLQLPPPTVFNFMRDLESTSHAHNDHLSFFDAGVDTNVGVPPLLNRNMNVYLICDASVDSTINDCDNALTKAATYAKNNSFKFPQITCATMGTDSVSLFYDDQDPEVPVVIYFPNQINFSTFKFQYTEEEFNQLYRSMKDTVEQSHQTICKGFSLAVNNLKKIHASKTALPTTNVPK